MRGKIFFSIGIFCLLAALFSPYAQAQSFSPAQEQELLNARAALEAAQKAKAEKYAPEPLKQAQDLIGTAENTRQLKDEVKFTQATRLAQAYAELARAIAELKTEEEKLAAIQEELQKAKAEVDRLKKTQ